MLVRLCVCLVVLLLVAPAALARTGPVELGAAINNHGFDFGGAAYRSTLALYDGVTVEHDMKFEPIQPERGRFEFDLPDRMLAWSEQQGQRMHGHTLVWCADETLPRWLLDRAWTRAELLDVLETHIETVMGRYRGRIPTWDVVNESFNADGTVRDCLWSRVFGGLSYVEEALRIARRVDPAAKLFYNEYRAENPNGRRFLATEALARDLKARGVPLDGVGIQHHIFGNAPFQWQSEEAFRRLGALGLDVHISEMDVPTNFFAGTTAEKLALQAQAYQTVAAACHAVTACFRLTTWGFTDRYSIRGWDNMALPFDPDYRAKPAWAALQRALRTPAPAAGDRVPSAPGRPSAPAAGRGDHSVVWAAAADPDGGAVTYTLEQRAVSGTAWRPIATGIRRLSYTFAGDLVERQGDWVYRVRASDGATDGPWSAESDPVHVDRGDNPLPPPGDAGEDAAAQTAGDPAGDLTAAKLAGGENGGAPATAASSGLPTASPRAAVARRRVRIVSRRVRLTRAGRARIVLACPPGPTCRGTVEVRGASRGVAFVIAGGRTRAVSAPLPRGRRTEVVATVGGVRTTLTVVRSRR